MIEVVLYSRQDCHLCEQVKEHLQDLQGIVPHRLKVVDVDGNPKLRQLYSLDVPVIEVGPYKLKAPISRMDLEVTLKAAEHRERQIAEVEEAFERGQFQTVIRWTGADRFTYWLSKHYLALLNLFVFVYAGVPFLAPFLMKAGATAPAGLIYRAYGTVCHQFAFRSIFLFGEQIFYPRAAAHVQGLIPYGQATGMDEADIWSAREYRGNETIGYKVALCERDMAIYFGILLFGVLFAMSGRRLPTIPWYFWLAIGIVPIGIDGFSQLISQPPLNFIPYRESTPLLRILTGSLFGFLTAWFGYPMVEDSMRDARQFMETKLKNLRKQREASKGNAATPGG